MSEQMRRYSIYVEGFGEHDVEARTAGAARYALFKRAREAGWFGHDKGGFACFLSRTSTLHLGMARP